jgi:UDP-N-acetylmuramate--alanine ligase
VTAIQGPVHLVGIGGKHMSAIAKLLLDRGVAVTGSDRRPGEGTHYLETLGAKVFAGHDAAHLGDAKLVVATAAVTEENPELAEAKRRGIPMLWRAEMIARLMEGKRVIAVAGAHGKTTTSTLIAVILEAAGRKPMYILGDESVDLAGSAAWGEGDLCVVEADEFKAAFHEYKPAVAVILNADADHLDYYGTPERYREAFVTFARRIVAGGVLVVCADDPDARAVSESVEDAPIRIEWYGAEGERHWKAANIDLGERTASFDVVRAGETLGRVTVNVPGHHFVLNTLAAAAVCMGLGVPFTTIRETAARFQGARRRFERVGEARGVLVMDDFAHNATEVRTTLAAVKRRFAGHRLIVIHQPYTYSRIQYLWDDWLRCFEGVDRLIVLETDGAREEPGDGPSARDLAEALGASYAPTHDAAADQAAALAQPGDVIFTMGCGDVYIAAPKILERLR